MSNVASLKLISENLRATEAKDVRRSLFERCREVLEELGEDVSGFAVVVWTRDGELRSAFDTGYGPLRAPLIPTLAGDALNRHVAATMEPARTEATPK